MQMKRKEFIEKSLLMGIGLPLLSAGTLLQSCSSSRSFFPRAQPDFAGKVVVVGAGAAGMAAGHFLKQYGIGFEIVEAAPVYGGRLKKAAGFADFPIDLGAEWIHVDPEVLSEIAGQPIAGPAFETIVYDPQDIQSWQHGELKAHPLISRLYSEWKFKRSTWFDFFEQCILPGIASNIRLSQPVSAINYGADGATLHTQTGERYEADKVLITVPIRILQQGHIRFSPALPSRKVEAINKVFVGDGVKIFIQFKEKFYPDILVFRNVFKALAREDKFVYDAAFKKGSGQHILGLFAINEEARAYTQLQTEEEAVQKLLAELDEAFEGQATANYVNHIVQNWSEEPYIQGAYSYSYDGGQKRIVNAISEPVQDRLYFAGEALSGRHHSTVHGACASGYAAAAAMIGIG